MVFSFKFDSVQALKRRLITGKFGADVNARHSIITEYCLTLLREDPQFWC
jgi:hypothetical protein